MANFPREISLDMRKATVPVSPVEPIELTQKKALRAKKFTSGKLHICPILAI